jgi:hypothetical protein
MIQQQNKDVVTLFQIYRSNQNNNRSSRWEVEIKINLKYYISHLIYQHITSLTFLSSIKDRWKQQNKEYKRLREKMCSKLK